MVGRRTDAETLAPLKNGIQRSRVESAGWAETPSASRRTYQPMRGLALLILLAIVTGVGWSIGVALRYRAKCRKKIVFTIIGNTRRRNPDLRPGLRRLPSVRAAVPNPALGTCS